MEHEVPVVRVEEVIPIEGADRIEAVRIGGYRSITMKGQYRPGDLAVYIPCGSLVPYPLIEKMGLTGKLSGSKKNRVKEIKLKGVLSEGLVLDSETFYKHLQAVEYAGDLVWEEGANYASALGIEKYEPAIPATMMGKAKPYPYTLAYDIENIKKYDRVFQEGEPVVMSEKIHGTLIQLGLVHNEDGTTTKFVTSKGLGKAGVIIQDVPENDNNLYLKTAKAYGLFEKLDALDEGKDVYIFGEVYGKSGQSNIQDLTYTDAVSGEAQFRAFDIYEGPKGKGRWLDVVEFLLACEAIGIPTVNYVYDGLFSWVAVAEHTKGRETMSGKGIHLREGIVIRPRKERETRGLGRVILKSVSEDYVLRKGGTEFN
jgi:RNA ligase (TIGR02306 family)